jgi:hypothetical protein
MECETIPPTTPTAYRGILATLATAENQNGQLMSAWLAQARPTDGNAVPAESDWLLARMMETYNKKSKV